MRESSESGFHEAAEGISGSGSARPSLTEAESEFARDLFEQYRLSIYRHLNGLLRSREEACDILQETYLRFLRQPSFEPIRRNARAYLFQTATNLARDLFRRRTLNNIDGGMEVVAARYFGSPDWMSRPELALEGEQVADTIVSALRDLEKPVRTALLLHRFNDLTHSQIAVRLGVSQRTIERYISQGLNAIAMRLEMKS